MLKTLRLLSAYLVLSIALYPGTSHAIQLKTTSSRLVGLNGGGGGKITNANALQNFISRPMNWPKIVLSSNRVKVIKDQQRKKEEFKPFAFFTAQNPLGSSPDVSVEDEIASSDTLRVGDTVVEFFALNQFQLEWTCTINEPGRLVVISPDGVPGIATDCVMDFRFDEVEDSASAFKDDATEVQLIMEYTPRSPLAVVATPALIVDNWLALNVLLPAAVDTQPLHSFRKLMGILYGVAGLAHLLDLLVGGSQLFTSVIGLPPFEDLDIAGQVYSLVWCAAGPIAYFLSTSIATSSQASSDTEIALNKADMGLIFYGTIEILGAIFSSGIDGASPDVLSNAVGVQAVVLAAWVYSRQKQEQMELLPRA